MPLFFIKNLLKLPKITKILKVKNLIIKQFLTIGKFLFESSFLVRSDWEKGGRMPTPRSKHHIRSTTAGRNCPHRKKALTTADGRRPQLASIATPTKTNEVPGPDRRRAGKDAGR